MAKQWNKVFALLFLLLLSVAAFTALPVKADNAIVNIDTLNVREAPSSYTEKLGQIHRGEAYPILGEKYGWLQIQYKGGKAWVAKYLVNIRENTTVHSDADYLRVRAESNTNSRILGHLMKGQSVKHLGTSGNWYKIKSEYGTGWIHSDYASPGGTSQSSSQPVQTSTGGASLQTLTLLYDGTNIRSGPSTSHKILGRAHKGDDFQVISKDGEWYKIKYGAGTAYVAGWIVTLNNRSNSNSSSGLQGKVVVIDPGHGGRDPGAIGLSGTYEKNVTLSTALHVKEKLQAAGAKVIMTRSNDRYISLSNRVSVSHSSHADVFLSLHYNSFPTYSGAKGIETFYHSSQDMTLAKLVQQGMIRSTGAVNRGAKANSFHVIRENNNPSLLLELGYLSNVVEEKMVKTSNYQRKLSTGIVNGLIDYFN
ncbi:N-acetylmuramoyl-L-alanine amidase [Thalassobacillus devorans]|uniref:N-acetylmuramoyl-L-alanine amidase n=1 Tax=Thalassobacillus devorans TaxID=279813 RepID=UPI00048AB0ED|nr:N-acetylmuramoyl-L-alanine amidase [Thalassobacillus devorans]